MEKLTTFIIPTIGRDTLKRAKKSVPLREANIRVLWDHDRVGPAIIRNEAIQSANTEWVSFLDDDDTVSPDYVKRLKEEIEAHPDADLIYFREFFLWGTVIPSWPSVEWGNCGISFSVKRKIALELPFQTEPFEDLEFVKRVEAAGYKIHFSKYLTYFARH